MSTFIKINGSPAAGIAILTNENKFVYLDNAVTGKSWSKEGNNLAAPQAQLVCGDNINGVVVAQGGAIAYLAALGVAEANWRVIDKKLPQNDVITGLAGDNVNGVAAVGAHGVYQLPSYDAKAEWKLLTAPFEGSQPQLIAGDVKGGLLVVGGPSSDQVARSTPGDCCSWTSLPNAPIQIKLITGNVASGFIAYGEGQLCSLDAGKGVWTRLPRPSFNIVDLSGNAKDGVVALLGTGDVVAYCTDPSKNPWIISKIEQQPKA